MQRAPRVPAGAVEITLPDRGNKIVLLLRGGIVVGAMGADPESWLGLTEVAARARSMR